MAESAPKLEEYTVLINGIEHTMMLTAEDADRYESASKAKKAPANKARSAEDK